MVVDSSMDSCPANKVEGVGPQSKSWHHAVWAGPDDACGNHSHGMLASGYPPVSAWAARPKIRTGASRPKTAPTAIAAASRRPRTPNRSVIATSEALSPPIIEHGFDSFTAAKPSRGADAELHLCKSYRCAFFRR